MKFLLLAASLLCSYISAHAQLPQHGEGYITAADGVKIFYKIVGEGSGTLVAVHGGPGNSLESIRADLEPLAKGRRVIYYDQRGNGRSELFKDGRMLGADKHVADLEAVRQHFKLEKMTLLGNSWGGLLISLYAVEHPERVERMVLHNPAPPIFGFLVDMGGRIHERMSKVYPPEKRKRYEFIT